MYALAIPALGFYSTKEPFLCAFSNSNSNVGRRNISVSFTACLKFNGFHFDKVFMLLYSSGNMGFANLLAALTFSLSSEKWRKATFECLFICRLMYSFGIPLHASVQMANGKHVKTNIKSICE